MPTTSLKHAVRWSTAVSKGVWLKWYGTGVLSDYSEWRDSLGDGTWIYFHPNGEVMERAQVVADRWNGVAEGWQPDGSKNYVTLFRQGVRTSQKNFGGKETAVVD